MMVRAIVEVEVTEVPSAFDSDDFSDDVIDALSQVFDGVTVLDVAEENEPAWYRAGRF